MAYFDRYPFSIRYTGNGKFGGSMFDIALGFAALVLLMVIGLLSLFIIFVLPKLLVRF